MNLWFNSPSFLYFFYIFFKVKNKNKNNRTSCEIFVKLTMKTPEQRLMSLLFKDFTRCCGVSILDFGQVNNGWIAFLCLFCNGMALQFFP